MTRIDLHPEDLLERAARGDANATELLRLEQHLSGCAVCRVERALAARAALDSAPLRDEELVVARLKRDVAERLRAPVRVRPRRRGGAVLLVAVAGLLASAAAAATVVAIRHTTTFSHVVEPPRPDAARPPPKLHVPTPPETAPVTEPPAQASPSAAPASEATTSETSRKPAPNEAVSASELFSRANQARREGKAKEAVRLYRSLQERFAGSSEELVSRVTLGRLLLDRLGDSRGALVQFNSYLASPGGGALREEAMVGRALALGRLGRAADERAAWRGLLEAFPRSTHEKRAKARLDELEAPRPGTR
jgi:hypothetical protein